MTAKKKTRKDGRKGQHTFDPVRVQISIAAKVPDGRPVAKSLIQSVVNQWAKTGNVPRGFKIKSVSWLNPKRKNKSLAVTKTANTNAEIERARTSLRLRAMLRSGNIKFNF